MFDCYLNYIFVNNVCFSAIDISKIRDRIYFFGEHSPIAEYI